MKNPTEKNVVEFFKNLNKLEDLGRKKQKDFLINCACMLVSGGVVGFIAGYFVGVMIWS